MNRAAALRIDCPKCGAQPHEPCVGRRGARKSCHAERYGEKRTIGLRANKGFRARRCNVVGWVYFIGPVSGQSVKIGWSSGDPERRLAQLQTGSDARLHVFGAIRGTQRDEKALHRRFSKFHLHGEWFEFDAAIKEIIPEPCE